MTGTIACEPDLRITAVRLGFFQVGQNETYQDSRDRGVHSCSHQEECTVSGRICLDSRDLKASLSPVI